MSNVKIIKRITIEPHDPKVHDWRLEVQLCQIEYDKKEIHIRPCYYSKQKRKDGSEFWNIAPRPPTFKVSEVQKVIDAMQKLRNEYQLIRETID